jgi:hypothetical protein
MNVKKTQQGDQLQLAFSGKIDEDADFSTVNISTTAKLEIDLDAVQTINSCGIREWIKWIRTAPASIHISYQKCPKVIVDQINMVEGFLPSGAEVKSFYVPYYNEDSGSEKNVLFLAGTHFGGGKFNPPTDIKDPAGKPMEIDVIEAKYFKFLEKLKG